jgi:hypothetical protein
MVMDETNLKSEDYKNICWSCLQYLGQVDHNWRTGSYKLTTSDPSCSWIEPKFAIGEDFITACQVFDQYKQVHIFDRESIESKLNFRPNCPDYKIIDMNTVVYADKNLSFHDTKTGQLIRRFKVNENSFSKFNACCPTAKLLTVGSLCKPVNRLDLLRVNNASNVTLIKTIEVPGRIQFKVDEQFILYHHPIVDYPKREITTCRFISTGIVHNSGLERSLSAIRWFEYDQGLMFFIGQRLIRVLDVASGTYLHDMHIGRFPWIKSVRVNSNYVVVIGDVCLYVYSLQALKNPLPSDAFLFKIKHNFKELTSVLVDETQIVCLGMEKFGVYQINVFDFGSVDLTTLSAP